MGKDKKFVGELGSVIFKADGNVVIEVETVRMHELKDSEFHCGGLTAFLNESGSWMIKIPVCPDYRTVSFTVEFADDYIKLINNPEKKPYRKPQPFKYREPQPRYRSRCNVFWAKAWEGR